MWCIALQLLKEPANPTAHISTQHSGPAALKQRICCPINELNSSCFISNVFPYCGLHSVFQLPLLLPLPLTSKKPGKSAAALGSSVVLLRETRAGAKVERKQPARAESESG